MAVRGDKGSNGSILRTLREHLPATSIQERVHAEEARYATRLRIRALESAEHNARQPYQQRDRLFRVARLAERLNQAPLSTLEDLRAGWCDPLVV